MTEAIEFMPSISNTGTEKLRQFLIDRIFENA